MRDRRPGEIIDRSHRGQKAAWNEHGSEFEKHFVIFKSLDPSLDSHPWLLYFHAYLAGWQRIGSYPSHGWAISMMDITIREENRRRWQAGYPLS